MASTARGEGPKPFSLAPSRARNGMPLWRSSVSGPVKGTVAGRAAGIGAKRKRVMAS